MYQLIRASAGSGKTFRLSGHFLEQLFAGNSPESILATTFTRKAAGEILERVLTRLARAASDPEECRVLAGFLPAREVTQERSLDLLQSLTQQLHRMRICTLDSFFQQTARSLTFELGLPPGWAIIDEQSDAELREQAIDATLAGEATEDARNLMERLAKGRSKRSVRELIRSTVDTFYDLFLQTDEAAWSQVPRLSGLKPAEIEDHLRELYRCSDAGKASLTKARAADISRFQAEDWEKFLDTGIAGNLAAGKTKFGSVRIPDDLAAAYEPLIQHATARVLEVISRQTLAVRALMQRFDREYTRLRAEHGWLRFADVTRVLASADDAADGRRMSFRMDARIRHLLLDEFQDTSPDQWRILRRLTNEITRTPEASEEQPATFFCVGDPKQAIYGWRGGEAAILDAVEAAVPGIRSELLDTSRRSARAVIETVNRVFRELTRHSTLGDYEVPCHEWSKRFPDHTTVHSDRTGYCVLRSGPERSGDLKSDWYPDYLRWVAAEIARLHQRSPGAEIGVLTRRNRTVARLVHELGLLGVSASEEGGTSPVDSPAVLALCSLLKLAARPGCGVSLYHVVNSPFGPLFGLTDINDSAAAAREAASLRVLLADEGYGPTLQRLQNQIAEYLSPRDRVRFGQVIAQGWIFDESPSPDPLDFVQALRLARLSRSEAAPVRVMTAHQSKGLEFDIVVLPELDVDLFRTPQAAVGAPGGGEAPDRVVVWRNRKLRSLLPQTLQQAFDQKIAVDVAESLCLLYVELTRAMHELHMLVPPLNSKNIPKTLQGLLLAALTDSGTAEPDSVLFESGDSDWAERAFQGIGSQVSPAEKSLPALSPSIPKSGRRRGLERRAPSRHDTSRLLVPHELMTGQDPDGKRRASRKPEIDPRLRGTIMHHWFEGIRWLSPDERPPADLLRKIGESYAVSDDVLKALLAEFHAHLERPPVRVLFDEAVCGGSEVLSRRKSAADKAGRTTELCVEQERPFVYAENGVVTQGTIDRLVLLKDSGQTVAADIADYKTDRLTGDPAAWRVDRTEHYRPQLEAYRYAVHRCFRVPEDSVSVRIVLLETGEVCSVS